MVMGYDYPLHSHLKDTKSLRFLFTSYIEPFTSKSWSKIFPNSPKIIHFNSSKKNSTSWDEYDYIDDIFVEIVLFIQISNHWHAHNHKIIM